MLPLSLLGSPITHSSLSAFLKDHRNVCLKTCLVNFLDTKANALNLATFSPRNAPWNHFPPAFSSMKGRQQH